MQAFQKVLQREHANDTRLGCPSPDAAAFHRRMHVMATMTGMRGFSVPPMQPRVYADGLTRGQRRRLARAAAMAKVSEQRAPEFMHSAARRRLEGYEPRPMTGFLATMKEAA